MDRGESSENLRTICIQHHPKFENFCLHVSSYIYTHGIENTSMFEVIRISRVKASDSSMESTIEFPVSVVDEVISHLYVIKSKAQKTIEERMRREERLRKVKLENHDQASSGKIKSKKGLQKEQDEDAVASNDTETVNENSDNVKETGDHEKLVEESHGDDSSAMDKNKVLSVEKDAVEKSSAVNDAAKNSAKRDDAKLCKNIAGTITSSVKVSSCTKSQSKVKGIAKEHLTSEKTSPSKSYNTKCSPLEKNNSTKGSSPKCKDDNSSPLEKKNSTKGSSPNSKDDAKCSLSDHSNSKRSSPESKSDAKCSPSEEDQTANSKESSPKSEGDAKCRLLEKDHYSKSSSPNSKGDAKYSSSQKDDSSKGSPPKGKGKGTNPSQFAKDVGTQMPPENEPLKPIRIPVNSFFKKGQTLRLENHAQHLGKDSWYDVVNMEVYNGKRLHKNVEIPLKDIDDLINGLRTMKATCTNENKHERFLMQQQLQSKKTAKPEKNDSSHTNEENLNGNATANSENSEQSVSKNASKRKRKNKKSAESSFSNDHDAAVNQPKEGTVGDVVVTESASNDNDARVNQPKDGTVGDVVVTESASNDNDAHVNQSKDGTIGDEVVAESSVSNDAAVNQPKDGTVGGLETVTKESVVPEDVPRVPSKSQEDRNAEEVSNRSSAPLENIAKTSLMEAIINNPKLEDDTSVPLKMLKGGDAKEIVTNGKSC